MRLKLLLCLFTLGIIAACSSPNETVTIGSSMTGKVVLRNSDLGQTSKDASGVTVSLLGTNFHTTTDASGAWTLSGMPPGIYSVVFTKPSYDSAVLTNTKFSGAGVTFVESVTLHYLTNSTLTLDAITLLPYSSGRDSNLVLTGTSSAGQVALQIQVNTRDAADSASWKNIYASITGWSGNQFTAEQVSEVVRGTLHLDPNRDQAIYFRAMATPEHGTTTYSKAVVFTIPHDSLHIDAVLLPHDLSGRDSNLSFTGFSTATSGHEWWRELRFSANTTNDPNPSTWARIYIGGQSWDGQNFSMKQIAESFKKEFTREPNWQGRVYFRAQEYLPGEDTLVSNTVSVDFTADAVTIQNIRLVQNPGDTTRVEIVGTVSSPYMRALETQVISATQGWFDLEAPITWSGNQFTVLIPLRPNYVFKTGPARFRIASAMTYGEFIFSPETTIDLP